MAWLRANPSILHVARWLYRLTKKKKKKATAAVARTVLPVFLMASSLESGPPWSAVRSEGPREGRDVLLRRAPRQTRGRAAKLSASPRQPVPQLGGCGSHLICRDDYRGHMAKNGIVKQFVFPVFETDAQLVAREREHTA